MAARELTHTLGAVLPDSPNATGAGSCTDEYDLLCGPDRSGKRGARRCARRSTRTASTAATTTTSAPTRSRAATSTKNWNVAQSEFLLRSDGGDDVPDAPAPGAAGRPASRRPAPRRPTRPAAPSARRHRPARRPPSGGGDAGTGPRPTHAARRPRRRPRDRGTEPPAPPAPATGPADRRREAAPVQAVLEVREPTSTLGAADLERGRPEGHVRGLGRRRADRHHARPPGPG